MLIYSQTSGLITLGTKLLGIGYSGHGKYVNNPWYEDIVKMGPIPRGLWRMSPPRMSANTGPYTLDLTPVGHDAHGRSLFRMHGDNKWLNKSASQGCIVATRPVRSHAWEDNDARHMLTVIQ